jgi:hypothetical protein
MTRPLLANRAARRLFLDRHALAAPPAGPATAAAVQGLVERLGFVQVDSINTVERAHHMILWSRLSAYRPATLGRLLERDRALWEHWTHDAAVLPVALWPLWQPRFAADRERLRQGWRNWFRDGWEAQFDGILDRIARDGPVTAAEAADDGAPRGSGGWWDWHPSKTALEWLWRTGRLAITRREGFRKVYDLTERVIPAAHRGPPPDPAALVAWAAGSALDRLGFGSLAEIAAFWDAVGSTALRPWADAALAAGEIVEIEVEGADGRRRRAFARPGTPALADALPEPPPRMRILSPFDPALRDRARAEHLFGFRYRIEVFVPEARRRYGYCVFPVLEGDRIVGRLDARARRDAGVLALRAFWPEPGLRMTAARLDRLDRALDRLARFAGCDRVDRAADWLRPP